MSQVATLRSAVRSGGLAAVALAILACGPGVGTTQSALPTPIGTAAATALPTDPSTPIATTPAASSGVLVDQTLLDLLPVDVGGVVLTSDPETAANIAADPALAGSVASVAVGFAIAPGASDGGDLAVAIVAQLLPGLYDDAFYASYRDSFDAAACRAAGGVEGTAQSDIAGRAVFIGTCSAGANTYHVYLKGHDAIISVTSVGSLRLGEQVIAGLRE